MRIYPHARIPPEAVLAGEWSTGPDTSPVGDHLPHWEPGQDVDLASTVVLPLEHLPAAAARGAADVLCISRVDCRATVSRFVDLAEATIEDGHAIWRIRHVLPGDQLAGEVLIQRALVHKGRHGERLRGTSLWSESWREVGLSGPGGRWRIVPASFADAQLPDVPWRVRVNPAEADDLLRACSEVMVNTDHTAGRSILDEKSPLRPLYTTLLKIDLIEATIGACAGLEPPDSAADTDSAETVWDAAALMARVYLRQSLEEVVAGLATEPLRVRETLRQELGYLKEEL